MGWGVSVCSAYEAIKNYLDAFKIIKKDIIFPQLNFKCPMPFFIISLCLRASTPYIAHIYIQGNFLVSEEFILSLRIWVLLGGCPFKGKSRLLCWAFVVHCKLASALRLSLILSVCTNLLFSLQRFYSCPFFLLMFLQFLLFGMIPSVRCSSHPIWFSLSLKAQFKFYLLPNGHTIICLLQGRYSTRPMYLFFSQILKQSCKVITMILT